MVLLRLLKILFYLGVAAAGTYLFDPSLFQGWAPPLPSEIADMHLIRWVFGGLTAATGVLAVLDGVVKLFREEPEPSSPGTGPLLSLDD